MSDITISVIQPPSTTINVGVDETTLIQAGMGLPPHSVTHISGGSDEINHNLLAELQGGSGGQYYHLSSGQYFNLVTGTGSFYPNNNPSGFITGVDLSPYATITYVTGISGQLQAQITVLNNQTGSYVLNFQTGQFYPSSNPSGFITGVDLSFSGNYYTKTESESRYVNVTGAETILGDKTFHDKVYINNLYVTGLETIVNTTNTNVASNYIMLNLTGGAVDGGIFFVTGSGLTGINDSGAIIGFDHSDEFKFGIGTRASDLSTLSTIASFSDVTGASGNLQTQINTLNSATGSYVLDSETGQFYPNSNPSGFITGINNIVYTTGNQIISGAKTFTGSFNVSTNDAIIIRSTGYTNGVEIGGGYFNKIADGGFTNDFGVGGTENHFGDSATSSNSFGGSAVQNDFGAYATLNNYYAGFGIGQFDFDTRLTVSGTGVLLEGEIPDTGYLSGYVNKNETGDFYPRTNPSGYITGINNLVFITGNQTISGAKTFSNNLVVGGNDLFVDTSTDRVGISTATPTATLDVNGSGLFRSGLNVNLITSTGSDFYLSGKNNATEIFGGSFIGGFVNLKAGSGNLIGGYVDLKGGDNGGYIRIQGGNGINQNANLPVGPVLLNSFSTEFNKLNTYSSDVIFWKTGLSTIIENTRISQDSISINNNLLITGNRPTVNSTGILLSGEATTQAYVTGISGGLQTQITTLNNQTGNYYTKDESESRYVNTTGAETILGNKTFHDNVYINNLYVTGLETIVNTTNTNVASNYITLNLTGGAVDGGIFFITGSGLTGINDSGAIIGFDHSDEFKFGISTRASDLSTLNTIASVEQMTGISGSLQTQISTLNNQTGSYVLKIESGQFYPNSNPSGFITGVDLSTYATQNYVTGISGGLQTQITDLSNATGSYVLNSQTGQFYANSNPSGFITGINNIVYTTGDQSISGNINISGNLTISGVYNIYQQIENAKILSIAYAIAL